MTLKLEKRSGDAHGIIIDPDDVWLTDFETSLRKGIEEYKARKETGCHTNERA